MPLTCSVEQSRDWQDALRRTLRTLTSSGLDSGLSEKYVSRTTSPFTRCSHLALSFDELSESPCMMYAKTSDPTDASSLQIGAMIVKMQSARFSVHALLSRDCNNGFTSLFPILCDFPVLDVHILYRTSFMPEINAWSPC